MIQCHLVLLLLVIPCLFLLILFACCSSVLQDAISSQACEILCSETKGNITLPTVKQLMKPYQVVVLNVDQIKFPIEGVPGKKALSDLINYCQILLPICLLIPFETQAVFDITSTVTCLSLDFERDNYACPLSEFQRFCVVVSDSPHILL